MLDFTNCNILDVIAHQVGNQTNDEELILSASLLNIGDPRLRELLIKYFLYPFKDVEEFYSFTFSDEDFNLNPQYATNIFLDKKSFKTKSESIAKHLYEIALHPQIKPGDLFVVTFENISIDGELVNALGLFKSENREEFLQLNKTSKEFSLRYDDGINIDKLDKGCLIFDTEKETGYRICVIDKSNRSNDARYWFDFFLNVKPLKTNFLQTNQFLGIAKQFVTKQLDEEFELNKADKIDFLNRSVDYFKTHDQFEKEEFEAEVFQDSGIIDSFQKFDQNYRKENEVQLSDNFVISDQAVKKQARAFKSVLKLDKNFHIYIHGDRNLIQQGTDENGRKFYKIFYENES
ncbi:MAG: nucleoid-associated protein [Candidatus Kuenenia stuttgartiensis]|nr:nucleoid-associated protein [Candidatus Kuenenia stuttgartiensis]